MLTPRSRAVICVHLAGWPCDMDPIMELAEEKGLHESFGANWRLTEMQSAIGRIQLRRLAEWQAARKRNGEAIYQAASTCPALRVPEVPGHIDHAWYKCYLFVRPQRLAPGWDRDRIMAAINDQGVPTRKRPSPPPTSR